MAKVGYARVSSIGQEIAPQIQALKDAGAGHIIQEKKSGKDLNRKGILEAVSMLQKGDTLIVTKLDRMARSLKDGIHLIEELLDRGIKLEVLNLPAIANDDNTSKLIRNILLSVAEWEREMILERQREGIESAKARGAYKTKPKKYTDKNDAVVHALELYKDRNKNGYTVDKICSITKMSRSTLYRLARERGIQ